MPFTFSSPEWGVCIVHASFYNYPVNLAIYVTSANGEPLWTCTINPVTLLPQGVVLIKDYQENDGMVEYLVQAGVITGATGETYQAGRMQVPVCRLTPEFESAIYS